ncbi:MAG: matrixin family metalloprotease [Candidatus Giovannonibacteria bacterium]|nr:MAG: matrixin family metalloprotease [Candidatus Giovannonibacteria bacterium]
MNKAVKITLLIAAIAALVYAFRGQIQEKISGKIELPLANFELPFSAPLSPCQKPIAYGLGAFDEKFGLTQKDFLDAVSKSEDVWERPMALELFSYKPGGALKINLIYDYRQDATLKLQKLGIAVKDTKSSYETVKAQYEAMKVSYGTLKTAYEKRFAEFEARQEDYNAEVASWNRRGGAPKDVYDRLTAEKNALDQEFSKIKALEAELNAKVDDINAFVVVLNRLAQTLNLNVAKYNEIGGSAGREFEEGTYRSGSGGEQIDIYQFDSRQKLVRVLAHELGHALGLEHLENSKAIMYRLNSGANETATPDDLAALKALCEIK